MGRMPVATTFSYGLRSKCADLSELLHSVSRKHVQDSIRIDIAGKLIYIQNINQYEAAGGDKWKK